jgi:hypothetical protein
VRAVADAGRLVPPVEAATRACWCSAHGVTSLMVAGFFERSDPAVALVRDALMAEMTKPASPRPRRVASQRRTRA